jgi:iron-sulfur cluster assembly accessory protein
MNDWLITITERAAAQIRAMRQSSGIDASMHLRVDVIGGAASGFAYDLFFDVTERNDIIVEGHDVTVLVRPDSAHYLEGSTLDWVESANGAGFLIANPNEPEK